MSQLSPGTILRNRYRIIGLIGAGGMGAVYLADDARLDGRRCAVKEQVLDGELAQSGRKQFHQEASILARLDHPGLPKVSDYFVDEASGRDYLVMDYVPGQNLEQLVKKAQQEGGFLAEDTVLMWMDQLCDILTYLHTRQPMVLHRDIKPANIKLTPENRLKLVDFGLAKPFDPSDPRTVTGLQGLGSLPYTPLEQYVGHLGHTDARADLYALGATCYHLVTGRTPPSAHERFLNPAVLEPPQALNPALSEKMSEAILWAMQLHPDNRAPSVAAWRAALTGTTPPPPHLVARGGQHTVVANTTVSSSATPFSQFVRENGLLLVIALILLALALIITFNS